MIKWIKEHLAFFIKSCIIFGLIILFIVLINLKNNVSFCESYSRGFGRVLMTALAACTKYLPFSLTEVFAVCCFILVIVWIVLAIHNLKKKNFIKFGNKLLNIVLLGVAILTSYFATMEIQYNRAPLKLPMYQENVDKSEFVDIISYFIDDYNDCASKLEFKENGEVISPYSISQINVKLEKEYKRLNDAGFDGYFAKFSTYCKPMLSSEIYSQFQITGVTFGCLGEANINTSAPKAGIPYTMAHEIAHTKGVLREGDANMVAMYLMLTSDDYFFRFSGYFETFYRLMSLASLTGNKDDYGKLANKIDPKIYANYSYDSKYWSEHDLMGKIGDWINNLYLKASGTEGTSSYQDTPTVIDEHEVVITFSNWQKIYFNIYFNK